VQPRWLSISQKYVIKKMSAAKAKTKVFYNPSTLQLGGHD